MAKMLNLMRKDIITVKKDQSEVKTDIALIKNTLEGKHRRLREAEDQISKLEDAVWLSNQRTKKKKTTKKQEDSSREL